MPFIITDPCVDTKDASCVDVCPVDCIHPTKAEPEFEQTTMLYIHPEECIDCGACVPACPVAAIYESVEATPSHQKDLKPTACTAAVIWKRWRRQKRLCRPTSPRSRRCWPSRQRNDRRPTPATRISVLLVPDACLGPLVCCATRPPLPRRPPAALRTRRRPDSRARRSLHSASGSHPCASRR